MGYIEFAVTTAARPGTEYVLRAPAMKALLMGVQASVPFLADHCARVAARQGHVAETIFYSRRIEGRRDNVVNALIAQAEQNAQNR